MSETAITVDEAIPCVKEDVRGHPKGLYVLFFTEMWERFAYYGMRSILMFYMIKHLMFAQDRASHIYGLYTGFVYFAPFFGGMIADKILGQRKSVVIGAVLMAIAHFVLIFESLFFAGLILLILGNGMFKPNISTQVGGLYKQGDHRRDRAFSIFYMGINLGAFFSPLICGTLGEVYGWHYGFGAAGIGMIVGLMIYLWGQKHLAQDSITIKEASAETKQKAEILSHDDRSKIGALIIITLFTIVFWAIYEQQGNTLALWADTHTNRHILGWEMPASWFQSFNPFMIFAFTPLITMFWAWQAKRDSEPTSISKMAFGCVLLGLSFLVLIPAAQINADGTLTSLWWLVLNTTLLTLGELYLSPVGLSLFTKLAPVHMVSMMMGVWFLASFFGNYLCGFFGTFWGKMPKETFFLIAGLLAMSTGLGMFAVLKPLKKAIGHGKPASVDA